MAKVVDTCKKHKVAVGHPHVEAGNAERIIKEGYTFLMARRPRASAISTRRANSPG